MEKNTRNILDENLYILGVNTTMGIAYLSNILNRYLDIELRYYTSIRVEHKKSVVDQMSVFANYTPKNSLEISSDATSNSDFIDLSDISNYSLEKTSEKYMLVQAKGEHMNLFSKIKQIDYVLISNYPLDKDKKAIQSVDAINYLFELNETHLGKKYAYFWELMR